MEEEIVGRFSGPPLIQIDSKGTPRILNKNFSFQKS
jgi:hypothetical protein